MSKMVDGVAMPEKINITTTYTECSMCGGRMAFRYEEEVPICAKCRNAPYPKGYFDPRTDGNFFYKPKKVYKTKKRISQ